MEKQAKITIEHPCPMMWLHMKKTTDSNRVCGSCTKEVVDFTKSSKEDIVEAIDKNPNICGKFRHGQLDISPLKNKGWSYITRFILLSIISVIGLHVKPVQAQNIQQYYREKILINKPFNSVHSKNRKSRYLRANEYKLKKEQIHRNRRVKGIIRKRRYPLMKRPIFSRTHTWIGCPSNLW